MRGVRAYLSRASGRRGLRLALTGIVVLAAVLVVGKEIDRHLGAIESQVGALGVWGRFLYVGLFALLTSVLVPESVLAIAAGALFGLAEGMAVVVAGNVLAAVLQFALARRVLRGPVQRALSARPEFAAIQRVAARSDWKMQALLRMTPLNQAVMSYLLGAAGVRFRGYLLATAGLVPAVLMETYVGYAGRHAARMSGAAAHGGWMHDLAVFGGLGVCVLILTLVSRRARAELVKELQSGEPGAAGSAAG